MKIFAAIDAGSNAVRMLVAALDDEIHDEIHDEEIHEEGRLRRLRYERTTTRLAEGLAGGVGKDLSPRSMERTLHALKRYRRMLSSYRLSGLRAVGTSALREAANAGSFVERVLKETGIRLETITHDEEARLSAKGVMGFLDLPRAFILDIGGGSTEWMLTEDETLLRSGSVPVGVVKLAGKNKDAMQGEIGAAALRLKESVWPLPAGVSFVITGGTASTGASIDLGLARYEHEKVHGHEIGFERLLEIYRLLASLPLEKRRRVAGLEPDRADLIIPGLGLIIKIMGALGLNRVIASDTGLPEGLILELLEGNADGTDRPF
ncbi:MAG: hypothetical protein M0Z48_12325 [Nitrospiraceae bacterium]|nr:hypothetical protein [Nitrospiraceae bacterium]